jgi:hypothetical protein
MCLPYLERLEYSEKIHMRSRNRAPNKRGPSITSGHVDDLRPALTVLSSDVLLYMTEIIEYRFLKYGTPSI